jgi:hypothetical protein
VLLCPATTLAEPVASTATPATRPNPEAAFAEAVKLFKGGNSARALPLFVRLGETTNSPNAQLYLGYCQLELGRDRAAHQAFSRAVKLTLDPAGSKYLATREAAQVELAKLNLRLASLTISFVELPEDSIVRLDGEIVDPALLGSPIMVDPGLHHVEAESKESKPITRDVSLDAGGFKVLALLFEKPASQDLATSQIDKHPPTENKDPKARMTMMGWVAGGIGLAGLGTFVVAGLQARSSYNKLQSECPQGCSDTGHRDNANTGKTYQTIANVGLVLGIVGTLTGATLVYLGATRGETPPTTVEVSQGLLKISYAGSF